MRLATKERMEELLDLRTVFTVRNDAKKIRHYRTLSDMGLVLASQRQFRKAIIQANMSDPHRPKHAKAPKPKAQQVKASARVRTYDAPSDMGQYSARFHDPSGNAFKARRQTKIKRKEPRTTFSGFDMSDPVINDYRFSDPTGYANELIDQRLHDAAFHSACFSLICADKGFPVAPPPSPLRDATASDAYQVPVYSLPVPKPLPDLFQAPSKAVQTGRALPRLLPLPSPDNGPSRFVHPKPKPRPVVCTVTKDGEDITAMEAPAWDAKARKRLFNRIPIQSRSAKKRGFRLIPRNPDTAVYMVLA